MSAAKLDFDDLQSSHGFAGFKTYGLSKLLNILFTRELARRLAGTGVTANSLHPGFVATRFGDDGSAPVSSGILRVLKVFAMTPEKGAQTIIYLASSDDVAQIDRRVLLQLRSPLGRRSQRRMTMRPNGCGKSARRWQGSLTSYFWTRPWIASSSLPASDSFPCETSSR